MTKTIQKSYGQLVSSLCSGTSPDGRVPSFTDICRKLRMPPSVLDELLLRELGMTGCELAASLRSASEREDGLLPQTEKA